MKVKVISAHDSNFNRLNEITSVNHNEYCCRHRYQYLNFESHLDNSRKISWSKLAMIYYNLKYTDWVFWIDNDAIFTNLNIPLSDMLGTSKHVCVDNVYNADWLNAGVFAIRNSVEGRLFLERVWNNVCFVDAIDWEQSSMKDIIKKYPDDCFQNNKIQSFDKVARPWKSGDFIFHAVLHNAGLITTGNENLKIELINEYLPMVKK